MDTASVTTPRTGRPFLDAVLDQPGAVLAFAHRGGAAHPDLLGLENTLAAFSHAYELGYRYLETDVHLSADGVLLAVHDAALDRVTGEAGSVADLSAAEAAQVLVGGREPVPTLGDLFDALPDARFNVDLKSDGAAAALVELITARRAHDRVLVGSFSPGRMREFRRLSAGLVATSATPPEVAAFVAVPRASYRNLPATVVGDFDALQLPRRRGPLPVVTAALVRRAHRAGRHVHVWTVDDPVEADELLALGVDGLMTDRTDLVRDLLVGRGRWLEAA